MARLCWLSMTLHLLGVSAAIVKPPQIIAPSPQAWSPANTPPTSLEAGTPDCRADIYGHPSLYSCRLALSRMPDDHDTEAMRLFSVRPPNPMAQYGVPWRTISPDGLCAIDVTLEAGTQQDLGNMGALRQAASGLISDCVQNARSGGSIGGLGGSGRLIVEVLQYVPDVECKDSPDPPDKKMCDLLMSAIPASESVTVFSNRPGPDVGQLLPKIYADQTQNCAIRITMSGDAERSQWYNIWAAGVAIVGMCSGLGKVGSANFEVGSSVFEVAIRKVAPPSLGADNMTIIPTLGLAGPNGISNVTIS